MRPAAYRDFGFSSDRDDEDNTLIYCCGVVEVGEFRCAPDVDWENITPDVLKEIKDRFRRINRMLVATTTETSDNQLAAASVLKATGWNRVSDYINPNSGNRVILWNYVP